MENSNPDPATRWEAEATERVEALPPQRFGRYIDPVLVARGGMGAILQAHDPELDRPVALKVALEPGSGDRDVRKFLLEARVTGQLEHPNIVPVHDLGTGPDGRPYFAMKLVKGRSLAEVLAAREGGKSLQRYLLDFLKICDAVAFAHSKRVVHRDLKPANVMLGEFGEVLVMDWGLAKLLDQAPESGEPGPTRDSGLEHTVAGTVVGTLSYMPPEQAKGEVDRVGVPSDVYALGAILYEMLAGVPPFVGPDSYEVLARVQSGEFEPPSARAPHRNVPRELEAVVLRAMAREPEARYPDVPGLAGDVRAWLEGRTLAAARYTILGRAWKFVRRHPAASAVLAMAVLLALSFHTAFAWREEARKEREHRDEISSLVAKVRLGMEARAPERGADRAERRRWVQADVLLRLETLDALDELADILTADPRRSVREAIDLDWVNECRAEVCRTGWEEALAVSARSTAEFLLSRAEALGVAAAEGEVVRARIRRLEECETWNARGLRCLVEGQPALAIDALTQAIEIDPTDFSLYANRGLARSLLRRDEEALADLDRATILEPGDWSAHLNRGQVLARAGRPLEALASFDRALEIAPDTGQIRFCRAETKCALADVEGALADVEAAIAAMDDPTAALALRGRIHRERGDLELALADFEAVLARDPRDPDALHGRSQIRAKRGDFSGALADVSLALEVAPRHSALWATSGLLRMQLGDLEGAWRDLEIAVRLAPTNPKARATRGNLRVIQGDLAGAIEDYDEAIRVDPGFAQALCGRADARRAARELDLAEADYASALEADPLFAPAHAGRAALWLLRHDPERAFTDAARATELDPSLWQAWRDRGTALVALGQRDQAIESLRRARDLAPSGENAELERRIGALGGR